MAKVYSLKKALAVAFPGFRVDIADPTTCSPSTQRRGFPRALRTNCQSQDTALRPCLITVMIMIRDRIMIRLTVASNSFMTAMRKKVDVLRTAPGDSLKWS